MGNSLVQGCKMNCQRISYQQSTINRGQIYNNQLLAQLPQFTYHQTSYNLRNSINTVTNNNKFLLQINQIPTLYLQYINYLFTNKKKHIDSFFPPQKFYPYSIQNKKDQPILRLCESEHIIQVQHQNVKKSKHSKPIFYQLFELLKQNAQQILQKIKPFYIQKVGIAICSFYINGSREDIIIDDIIPANRFQLVSNKSAWFMLAQKAFAKVLGSYQYISDFSIVQIFQQITGIPVSQLKSSRQSIIRSDIHLFKDVIQNQKIFCLQGSSKFYQVVFWKNYFIQSCSLPGKSLEVYYQLKLQESQKISIKISFLNIKYDFDQRIMNYPTCTMSLWSENGHKVYDQIVQDQNSTYLQNVIINLTKGVYFIKIKRSSLSRKANLVVYSPKQISLRQKQNINFNNKQK